MYPAGSLPLSYTARGPHHCDYCGLRWRSADRYETHVDQDHHRIEKLRKA